MPGERVDAARLIGAELAGDWPQPDLLDVLPLQAAASPEGERFGVWLLIERESARVVGDTGFLGPPGEDGTVEIGYSVVPSRRRQGYATEAVAKLVDWALDQPGVQAVVAECEPDNEPSIRILDRLGFARAAGSDGRLRWRRDRTSSPTG